MWLWAKNWLLTLIALWNGRFLLIPVNRKKGGNRCLLISKRGIKVGTASSKNTLLNIVSYWPSLCLSGISICVCRENYIKKDREDDPSLDTGIANIRADNSGTNIVKRDKRTNNLGPSIGIGIDTTNKDRKANNWGLNIDKTEGKADTSGTNTGTTDIRANNLGIRIADRDRRINDPGQDISITNEDKWGNNLGLSTSIPNKNKRADN